MSRKGGLRRIRGPLFVMVVGAGCSHSDSATTSGPVVGPFDPGAATQLTFNTEQDYWPSWTQDGRGILYSFVDPAVPRHRCLGLLPASGGTRIWQLCDNRAVRDDSLNSYTGYALSRDGRLLYSEAVARRQRPDSVPAAITLWLADTATPLQRIPLLAFNTLPLPDYSWLADIEWTGPNSFIALAQTLDVARPSFPPKDRPLVCAFSADSGWSSATQLIVGAIASGRATTQPVSGTAGATSYSLSSDGASVFFTRSGSTQLFRAPIAGGSAIPVATIPSVGTLLGVSCRQDKCVVASDAVVLPPGDCAGPATGARELWGVALSAGTTQLLLSSPNALIVGPRIASVTGDVVLQLGGVMGHLGTYAGLSNGNLYLYPGLVR